MNRKKLAGILAAAFLGFTGVTAVQTASAPAASANGCEKSKTSNYGDFTVDDTTQSTVDCTGKKTEGTPKPAPKPTPTPTPTPPKKNPVVQVNPKPKPKPTPDPVKPRPRVQSDPTPPKPVVHADPIPPKPVVRQDAKPPAKISATATKVCVVRVPVKNSGGTAAKVKVGKKIVTVNPGRTVVVEVPVGADGKWSVTVSGPGYKKTFRGGCDCARTGAPALAAAAMVNQNAVPQVEWKFPWLVVAGGALLTGAGGVLAGFRAGRKRGAPSAS